MVLDMAWENDITSLTEGRKADRKLLLGKGFVKSGDTLKLSMPIMNGSFMLSITIDKNGLFHTDVLDVVMQEPYTLYRNTTAIGSFVGLVRSSILSVLKDVVTNCYEYVGFTSTGAEAIIRQAKQRYGAEPEFLWEKFPQDAVIRRADNKKWYVLLVRIRADKLDFPDSSVCEIADLTAPAEAIPSIVDGKRCLKAYHMNKRHWYTIRLDNGMWSEDELGEMLAKSRQEAGLKR